MDNKFTVSLSPHEKGPFAVSGVMWGVVIALVPALIMSVVTFGPRALLVIGVSILVALVTEYIADRMLGYENTTADGSVVITGLLLAFNLPAGMPLPIVAIGSLFAVAVGKMAFGGLGKNPFNPALVGRAFLLASFPSQTTTWPIPGWGTDGVTAATALGTLKEGGGVLPSHLDLLLGHVGGSIGEVSALAILIGGIFMIATRIIKWHIPVFFLGGLAAFTGIFYVIDPVNYADPLYHVLAGGAMLGAWFMATDMVTSPMSTSGKIVFALGGGLLCGAIRIWGSYPEGTSYAILIMNALVPLIDKKFKPTPYGKGKVAA
ncbi:RnfABCDGE type electron transport complex subunit D [Spirochaeta cellobiosiphila]|uniref:RnfABCDGE type electron transport complex subunit D n=1 Tax=Spirochaeta cellobiosiphila TaxID=504483 RepID=UPI00040605F3|nr:RnfABCDGE type electron transport complex subunit D [Spirochaeta cellobiosiphila]